MRDILDIKRMRYIIEVAKLQNITVAATELRISQPALTRSIAEVEEQLHIRLFDRLPRGVQLTEDGHNFINRAKRIVEEVDSLASEIGGQMFVPTTKLRVGFSPAGYLDFGAPTLIELARDYPNLAIETFTGTPQSMAPRLLHGDLDLLIGSSHYLAPWRELEIKKLIPLEFACVFRKDHPISKLKNPTENDVLQYPTVMVGSLEPAMTDLSQRTLAQGMGRLRPLYITDSNNLAFGLVNSSDAFFPYHWILALMEKSGQNYHLVRNVMQIPCHHVCVATSFHRPKSKIAEIFEQMLIERTE
jgi:LysR family transcriptional regulator of gallate degradation